MARQAINRLATDYDLRQLLRAEVGDEDLYREEVPSIEFPLTVVTTLGIVGIYGL